MSVENQRFGMGWLPDLPDFRDFSFDKKDVSEGKKAKGAKKSVKEMLQKIGVDKPPKASLPYKTDWL